MKKDLVDNVDQFFSVQNFISTHDRFRVLSINGLDMWPEAKDALVVTPSNPTRPDLKTEPDPVIQTTKSIYLLNTFHILIFDMIFNIHLIIFIYVHTISLLIHMH